MANSLLRGRTKAMRRATRSMRSYIISNKDAMFTEEHLGKFGFGEDERPEKATKHRLQLGSKTSPLSMYARSHENMGI